MRHLFLKRLIITIFCVVIATQPLYTVTATKQKEINQEVDHNMQRLDSSLDGVANVNDQTAAVDNITNDVLPTETQTTEFPYVPNVQPKEQKSLNFNVDESSGAFIYTYPINVPKGRADLQPDLKLVYNNQNSTAGSLYGYGWSLSMPEITRLPKFGVTSMYDDNIFSSSLDGELVAIQLSDGLHGIYGARIESGDFRKYEFLTDGSWKITDKLGVVYLLGDSTDSRSDNPNDTDQIYRWLLSRITDSNDNFIQYNYYKELGQLYPQSIRYTGNGLQQGIYEISFIREPRVDVTHSNRSGYDVETNERIVEIQIKVNGVVTHTYHLNFVEGDSGTTATVGSISETGYINSVPQSIPDTVFSYATSSTAWLTTPTYTLPVSFVHNGGYDTDVRIADVNADGFVDFVANSVGGGRSYVYINNGDGTGWTEGGLNQPLPVAIKAGDHDEGTRIIDVNADGYDDVILSRSAGNIHNVYINNGDGTGWTYDANYIVPFSFYGYNQTYDVRPVDVNADGFIDFIQSDYTNGTTYSYVFINNADGTGWALDVNYIFPTYLTENNIDSGVRMFDVNGDGLTDAVRAKGATRQVFINKGDGTGWTLDSNYVVPVEFTSTIGNNRDMGVRVEDVNGDGLADLIKNTSFANDEHVYLNKGDGTGWALDASYQPSFAFVSGSTGEDLGVRMIDFNSDGLADFSLGASNQTPYINIKDSARDKELIVVKESKGAEYKISYNNAKEPVSGQQLNPNLPLPIRTVASVETHDGIGQQTNTNYTFERGDFYRGVISDKRFSGFGKVTKEEGDQKIITYYHQANETTSSSGETEDVFSKIGKPYRQEIINAASNLVENVKIFKWDSTDLGHNNNFVFNTSAIDISYAQGVVSEEKATLNIYDQSNGNLLEQKDLGKVIADSQTGIISDTLPIDDRSTLFQYASNSSKHIFSAPKTKTLSGSGEVKDQDLYYDQLPFGQVDKVNLTKEDLKVNTVDIETTFNNYGLPLTKKDPKDNTALTVSYDAANLFVATSSDALGRQTTSKYDYGTGELLLSKDPNGYKEKNTYDAFGRIIKKEISNPVNVSQLVTKQDINYEDVAFPNYKQVKDYFASGRYTTSREYYDGLGRVILTKQSTATANQFITVAQEYDAQGRVKRQSLPYITASINYEAGQFINSKNYTYDAQDRILTETTPTGVTSYSYDGLVATITDPRGKMKKLTNDAHGNLVKVEEFNNGQTYTTNYEYTLTNKLKKITDAQGNIRTFTYDALDNLTQQDMVHKHSVSNPVKWTYTYDKNGNVLSKLDPKSQTVNYTYDALNRLTQENFTGKTGIEYALTYDQGSGQLGRLTQVVSSDGVTITYTYDQSGRPLTVSRTIDGQTFVLTFTYDWSGNVTSIVYPEGERVDYIYNDAAQITQVNKVKNNQTTILAQNVSYSPLGQVAHLERGNGVITDYTYDASQSYRLTRLRSVKGGTVLQDISYTYDPNGNILTLTDAAVTALAKNVVYTYDDLNRLASVTVTNSASGTNYSHSYTYDSIGNILTSDIGSYTYTLNNPHQARIAGSTTLTYDNNGNVRYVNSDPMIYDYRDRLSSSSHASSPDHTEYVYDHTNQRIKKHTIVYVAPPGGGDCENHPDDCPDPILGIPRVLPPQPTPGKLPTPVLGTDPVAGGSQEDEVLNNTEVQIENTEKKSNLEISPDSEVSIQTINNTDELIAEPIEILPTPIITDEAINPEPVASSTDSSIVPVPALVEPVVTTDDLATTTDPTSLSVEPPIEIEAAPSAQDIATYYVDKYYEKQWNGSSRNHYFLGNIKLGYEILNGTGIGIYYNLPDHLGSSVLVTNSTGTITELSDYYPYGKIAYEAVPTNTNNNYHYTGKELDTETDLSYFGARYYAQNIGRFMAMDPAFFKLDRVADQLVDPQSLNSYSYTRNNPVVLQDPNGEFWHIIAGAGVGAVVSGGITLWQTHDWNQAKNAAVGGAIQGGLFAAIGPASLLETAATGAGTAIVGNGITRSLNGEQPTAQSMLTDGTLGAVGGALGYGGSKVLQSTLSKNASNVIPDEALVCRGGTCNANQFESGNRIPLVDGKITNVSVQSASNMSFEQLSKNIPNGQIGVTTAGQIRALGGDVVSTPSRNNPYHATLKGITPKQAQSLFQPTKFNPWR